MTFTKKAISFILFYFPILLSATATNVLKLTDSIDQYDVSTSMVYFADTRNEFDSLNVSALDSLTAFMVNNTSPINLGLSDQTHWFRFQLENLSSTEEWMLEIKYPTLNDVSIYLIDTSNTIAAMFQGGIDFKKQNIHNNSYSVHHPFTLEKGKSYKVYLRLKTDSYIILPITIATIPAYIRNDRITNSVLYFFYGIIIALIAFNLILFILTKNWSYFLFAAYLLILSINANFLYGFGLEINYPMSNFFQVRIRQVLFGVASLVFLLFSVLYLNIKRYKFIMGIYKALIALMLLFTICVFIPSIPNSYFNSLSPFLYIFGAIISFVSGILAFRKGQNSAMYYIISFSVVTLASVIYFLTLNAIIPYTTFGFGINIYGTVLFGLLLTIGINEKITFTRKEHARRVEIENINKELEIEINERIKVEMQLRESEERFKLLFELDPLPVALTEINSGRIINMNHNMELLSGFSKHEAIGRNSIELKVLTLETRNAIIDEIKQNGFIHGKQILFKPKEHAPLKCLFYGKHVRLGNQSVLISIFSDISNFIKQQEILIESEKRLRILNNTKDKFFSIIAHDLMNPFNALLGFSKILIESIQTSNNEESMTYARIIDQSTNRISETLQNLLLWSRSQSGRITMDPVPVNVFQLVLNSVNVLRNIGLSKNLTFKVNIDNDLIISLDQKMINSVLMNLLHNAIKFSNEKGSITIELEKLENEYCFIVEDQGIGMDDQVIKDLFNLDQSSSRSGTKGEIGTGLGLIICHDFVMAHHGRIWAESEPNKGSRFYFTIPIDLKSKS